MSPTIERDDFFLVTAAASIITIARPAGESLVAESETDRNRHIKVRQGIVGFPATGRTAPFDPVSNGKQGNEPYVHSSHPSLFLAEI